MARPAAGHVPLARAVRELRVGLLVMIVVMFVQRRLGIGLDFFSVAWALVITVLVTRFLGQRIDYERPLGQVVALFRQEITGPRARTAGPPAAPCARRTCASADGGPRSAARGTARASERRGAPQTAGGGNPRRRAATDSGAGAPPPRGEASRQAAKPARTGARGTRRR